MALPALCQKIFLFAILLSSAEFRKVAGVVPKVRSFPSYNHGNSSVLNDSTKDHLTSPITTVVIPVISSIILIIGLPANGLALWVLATKVQRVPSTIFLMNLASADLLLILALPFKIHYHFQGNNWVFGEALCRTMTAFFYGNMYCSILLLTVISIDRYFALVHPFYSKGFRDNRFAVVTCLTIWILVGLSTIPFFLQKQVYSFKGQNVTTCHDILPIEEVTSYSYYFVCLIAFGFLIPCLTTIFCDVSVIRALVISTGPFGPAVRNMTLVMIVFVLCFAPSNIILLIHHSDHGSKNTGYLYHYYVICLMLCTLNNCIDPFIYYYVSDEFRSKVRSLIFCERMNESSRKSARPLAQTNTSSTTDCKVSSS